MTRMRAFFTSLFGATLMGSCIVLAASDLQAEDNMAQFSVQSCDVGRQGVIYAGGFADVLDGGDMLALFR